MTRDPAHPWTALVRRDHFTLLGLIEVAVRALADKPVDAAASKLKEKLSKGAPKAEKPADDTKEG